MEFNGTKQPVWGINDPDNAPNRAPYSVFRPNRDMKRNKKYCEHPAIKIQELLDILIIKVDRLHPYYTDIDFKNWEVMRPVLISCMSMAEEWRQEYNILHPKGKSSIRIRQTPLTLYKRHPILNDGVKDA